MTFNNIRYASALLSLALVEKCTFAQNNVLEMLKKSTIQLDECTADAASNNLSVNCAFKTTGGFIVHAEIRNIACADFNFPPSGGSVKRGEDYSTIVTTKFEDENIMAEGENSEKGNGITPYKRTYCARCDLFFAPSENEKISLMAKQIDITVSYELATIGEECLADSCSAEDQDSSKYKVLGVDTAEFVPAGLNVEIGM